MLSRTGLLNLDSINLLHQPVGFRKGYDNLSTVCQIICQINYLIYNGIAKVYLTMV